MISELIKISRKARLFYAQRSTVAAQLRSFRTKVRGLKAKVASLSATSIAIELHWMRSEVEAYRKLKGRISEVEDGLSKREIEIGKKIRAAVNEKSRLLLEVADKANARAKIAELATAQAKEQRGEFSNTIKLREGEIFNLKQQLATLSDVNKASLKHKTDYESACILLDSIEKENSRLRRSNGYYKSSLKDSQDEANQARRKLSAQQERLSRRELTIDENMPVYWRAAYTPVPPESDPIYRLRLQ